MTDSNLPKIELEREDLSISAKGLKTEWLITNGLGGYASSTVAGLNTRKYHGLLVASLNPPVERRVLLSRVEEEVHFDDETYSLGTNELRSGIQPEGWRHLTGFWLNPFPTFVFQPSQSFQLKKTVIVPYGKNASIITYEASNSSGNRAAIALSPFINCRDFHAVAQGGQTRWNMVQKAADTMVFQPSDGSLALLVFSDGRYVSGSGEWIESYYRVEAERGESSLDSNFKPGSYRTNLGPNENKRFSLIAVVGKNEDEAESVFSSIYEKPGSLSAVQGAEMERRANYLEGFMKLGEVGQAEDWMKWLVLAADAFIVTRRSTATKSVIAGYHWFNDWGRDSLISLPGLTLVTGRFDDAKQILLTFQRYCKDGLVPNVFPDRADDKPAYNTVDATLWYFNAVFQFLKYTNEFEFVREQLWPTLESIIDRHARGTYFDIHLDKDGLLAHGPQLTWMDAAPDGKPVTPRNGKAVEIQALWCNALRIMQLMARRFGQRDEAESYRLMAEKTQKSFQQKFWNRERNCLFDVVVSEVEKDDSLRPNQILAVALDFPILDSERAKDVVETVWKQLLTPYGLRTLVSDDSRYVGQYRGDRWQRDRAYHNGTVWPWLLGPFTTAFLKMKRYESSWRSYAFENFLKPLLTQGVYQACLGSIAEVFDGDSPHEPNGCVAQAWSVAEPLRAYVEDVLFTRPPYEKQVLSL